jgi:hypothetical protein
VCARSCTQICFDSLQHGTANVPWVGVSFRINSAFGILPGCIAAALTIIAMKIDSITLNLDTITFTFARHEAELRRRATEWFAEALAKATSQERQHLAERVFVDGEALGSVYATCRFYLSLCRTLRVPDDGRDYPLPAGLGRLPIRNLRSLESPAIPPAWRGRPAGLVCLHPTEATWLSFGESGFFALQVAAGGINAITGTAQEKMLVRDPQNYVVTPEQPWLDGFRVGPDAVRQFVAMPLGKGFTAEGQVAGAEKIGGLQLRVIPPQIDVYWEKSVRPCCERRWRTLTARPRSRDEIQVVACCGGSAEMGFGAGGRIRQKIYADPHPVGTWDESAALACELHVIDARRWPDLTGEQVPTKPPTPQQYADAGIPWFYYESEAVTLAGQAPIAGIKSVGTMFSEKTGMDLPDNDMIEVAEPIKLGSKVGAGSAL